MRSWLRFAYRSRGRLILSPFLLANSVHGLRELISFFYSIFHALSDFSPLRLSLFVYHRILPTMVDIITLNQSILLNLVSPNAKLIFRIFQGAFTCVTLLRHLFFFVEDSSNFFQVEAVAMRCQI